MQLKRYFIELFNDYQEAWAFVLVVIMGVFMKSYHAKQKGQKLTAYWFISEAIMSFCVALTTLAIFDQWLKLDRLLTYIICAWAGSASTIFHRKFEELFAAVFDGFKIWIAAIFEGLKIWVFTKLGIDTKKISANENNN